jgi:hypothetical protein
MGSNLPSVLVLLRYVARDRVKTVRARVILDRRDRDVRDDEIIAVDALNGQWSAEREAALRG